MLWFDGKSISNVHAYLFYDGNICEIHEMYVPMMFIADNEYLSPETTEHFFSRGTQQHRAVHKISSDISSQYLKKVHYLVKE